MKMKKIYSMLHNTLQFDLGYSLLYEIIKDVFVLKLREVFPGVSAPYHNKNWININLQCGRGFWK